VVTHTRPGSGAPPSRGIPPRQIFHLSFKETFSAPRLAPVSAAPRAAAVPTAPTGAADPVPPGEVPQQSARAAAALHMRGAFSSRPGPAHEGGVPRPAPRPQHSSPAGRRPVRLGRPGLWRADWRRSGRSRLHPQRTRAGLACPVMYQKTLPKTRFAGSMKSSPYEIAARVITRSSKHEKIFLRRRRR
jgi:hypothetical protein